MSRQSISMVVASVALMLVGVVAPALADKSGDQHSRIHDTNVDINAKKNLTSKTPTSQSPTTTAAPVDDPAPSHEPAVQQTEPEKPHPTTRLVTDANCSELQELCYTWDNTDVCDSYIASYEQRKAADPTIPEEDWMVARLVHYRADGRISAIDSPQCINNAPAPDDPAPAPPPPPVVTDQTVAREFQVIPLPVPEVGMSPPFPACVHLNVPNYVYVNEIDTRPITRTLLGTPITIYPRVVNYTWDFGDGSTLTTTDPGAPYPDGTVSHTYTTPGRYQVTVTARWAADWESPTHARSAVPGQAATTSAPGIVWAHEVHVVLVNDPDATLPTKTHDPDDACYAG